jgi:hypothetical protein
MMTAPENLRCTICSRAVDNVEELRILPTAPLQVRFCGAKCAPCRPAESPGRELSTTAWRKSTARCARRSPTIASAQSSELPTPRRRRGGDAAARVHRRCPRAPVRVADNRRPDLTDAKGHNQSHSRRSEPSRYCGCLPLEAGPCRSVSRPPGDKCRQHYAGRLPPDVRPVRTFRTAPSPPANATAPTTNSALIARRRPSPALVTAIARQLSLTARQHGDVTPVTPICVQRSS